MLLLLKNEWEVKDRFNPADGKSLIENILISRGILDSEKREEFLNPALEIRHDPFLLEDMDKACNIIEETVKKEGRILIFGDYDVDGVTSTASLMIFLKNMGAEVSYLIPDRMAEGYGLSQTGVEKIVAGDWDLVITVDCGISSIEEIDFLKKNNVSTIITDHHECKEVLPNADAVINPKRPEDIYPFKHLSGAGVVMKLIQALSVRKDKKELWKECLDLTCLGTVGDIVPLTGENRMIAVHGIKMLNDCKRTGLNVLIKKLSLKSLQISTVTIGYSIGPNLNAAGRMGDGSRAVELLVESNEEKADILAQELIDENTKRKETETVIIEHAKEKLSEHYDPLSYKILIAYDESWHQGVLGIAASKLSRHFKRCVIIFGWDGELYKGSARSFGQENILEAIEFAREYTVTYGGHKKAAGVSVAKDDIEKFMGKIDEYASGKEVEALYKNTIEIDYELGFKDLTLKNAKDLERLEPSGEANTNPLFMSRKLYVCRIMSLSGGKHQKFVLSEDDLSLVDYSEYSYYNTVEAIAFGIKKDECEIRAGDIIDCVYNLNVNRWRGNENVQLLVKDIRKRVSKIEKEIAKLEIIYNSNEKKALERINSDQNLKVHVNLRSENFNRVYRFLKSTFGYEPVVCDLEVLASKICDKDSSGMSLFKLARIFDIFEEINLLDIRRIKGTRIVFRLLEVDSKVNLSGSDTYKIFCADRVK